MFRWREIGEIGARHNVPGTDVWFQGWIGGRHVFVSQQGDRFSVSGVSPKAAGRFFSLDADLPAIASRINADPFIHEALKAHWGLRVIRQEPWECTAAFILSAFNNIVRLTGMLDRLAAEFGEPALTGADPVDPAPAFSTRRFPRPERLARVPERALRACGLGYRAPYLKAAAAAVASSRADLEGWTRLEDGALREKLLTLPGVGEKVAECVMLFGYGRNSAFPVDVWIARVMRTRYFRGRKVPDWKVRKFARKHFGPECGWAQQYLFQHNRYLVRGSVPGTASGSRERASLSSGRSRPG